MGIAMKKEKKDHKKKYSKLGSLVWAMKKLARLDARFVLFIFATVPVAVVTPLVKSLFSKTLIDDIGAGKNFKGLVITVSIFIGIIFVLDLLQRYIQSRCKARRYYPTTVYQNDMDRFQNYETDFENTEKQKFQELCNYAWGEPLRISLL